MFSCLISLICISNFIIKSFIFLFKESLMNVFKFKNSTRWYWKFLSSFICCCSMSFILLKISYALSSSLLMLFFFSWFLAFISFWKNFNFLFNTTLFWDNSFSIFWNLAIVKSFSSIDYGSLSYFISNSWFQLLVGDESG